MRPDEVHLKAHNYGVAPVVHAVEGDTYRILYMYPDDEFISDLNTVELAIHRPDGSYYTIPASIDNNEEYCFANIEQALTRPGKVECQLKIYLGASKLIRTYTFYIMVQEAVDGLPVEQLGYTIYDLMDAAQTLEGGGLTDDIKEALLDCFAHVAWVDEHGQDYYDALEAALYPPATLESISAVYTQSGTVYPTASLDDLEEDLVVTATYSDSSTETVTTYTLSGSLTVGTSTITVTYEDKTTTFNVTVTAVPTLSSITAVYTQSGTVYDTDSLDSLKADLVVTAVYSDSTTQTVASTDYTLSGTLTEGTSTITVSYGGKTTTFTVTVTREADWDDGVAYSTSVYSPTTDNKYLNRTDGAETAYNNWKITNYVNCKNASTLVAEGSNIPSFEYSFFYDDNDSVISGAINGRADRQSDSEGVITTITVPSNAKTFRISEADAQVNRFISGEYTITPYA